MAVLLLAASASAAPPVQREARVRAVTVARVDGAFEGRETPISARLSSNRARVPSVGISEELSTGTGDQWLTTLWQAALVATQATGSSLLDFEFSLRVGGPIDGPSAGLLTAATLAALIKGHKVLPHSTITGSINPDGSAGPVEGTLERLRAAAAGGVKRFGVPMGARQQGEGLDLLVEGKRLGVEVRELASLDDAFLFLTGRPLPRPTGVSEAEMELWPAELSALSRLTTDVRAAYDAELPRLQEAPADHKARSAWSELLQRATQKAADFAKNGDTVRAMVVWSSALITLRVATQDAALVRALDAEDAASVLAIIKEQEEALPIARQALRAKIDAQFPSTSRANDVYAADLLESVVTQGWDTGADGKQLHALGSGAVATEQFRKLARRYAEALLRARGEVENGERFLALYASLPPLKKSLPAIDAARLTPWYVSAAAAAQASLKTQLPARRVIEQDPTYRELVGYGELLATERDPRARLVLAARQTIYSDYLVNTYDALGAQLDAKGALTVRNARALTAQLELAKARVLQTCGQAKRETGSIPFPARMRFLNARAAREGSDRQKTDALAELWLSNWWCEFVVRDKR